MIDVRGVPIGAAAACALAVLVLAAPSPAAGPIGLDWTEYAPLCNRISTEGVSNCGQTRYPAVFRLRVTSLVTTAHGWSLSLSLTNVGRHTLALGSGPIKVCTFATPDSTDARCLVGPQGKAVRLDPGAAVDDDLAGTGGLASGRWLRVELPVVTGRFSSPTGGAIGWVTVHAYRLGPGGHSVAHATGTG